MGNPEVGGWRGFAHVLILNNAPRAVMAETT